jgi:hypothetical protein
MNNLFANISRKAKYLLIALLLPFFIPLNSCKENTGNLTPALLPKSDLISAYSTDTTTVITSMYLKDSANPSNGVQDILLGSFNDPVFGESKASLYAEVGQSTLTTVPVYATLPPWAFNGPNQIDSAVVHLQIYPGAHNYGAYDPQTFEVFQLDTDILAQNLHSYNSDTTIPFHNHPIPIGSQQVTPPNTTITTYNTLKIKLNKSWATSFAASLLTNNQWTTNFNHVLHGIYITTSTPLQLPGQGGLLNILSPSLADSMDIFLYYHPIAYPIPDSEHIVTFPIGGSANAYFVHFDHNYSTTYLGSLHPTGPRDSVPAGQLMYVQAMGGVNGRVDFPNLYKNWSKLGHIIVNEATISFPTQPESTPPGSYSPQPTALFLLAIGAGWTQISIPDLGQPYYGGGFGDNNYTFVITQYIQDVINGTLPNTGLYLVANNQPTTANGVVVYGAQHGVSKAQKTVLTIYYTPNH